MCSALATRRVPRSDVLRSPRRRRSRAHRPTRWPTFRTLGPRCPVADRDRGCSCCSVHVGSGCVSLREALVRFVWFGDLRGSPAGAGAAYPGPGRDGRGLRAGGSGDGARTLRCSPWPLVPTRPKPWWRTSRRSSRADVRCSGLGGVPVRGLLSPSAGGRGAAGGDGPAVARIAAVRSWSRARARGRCRARPDHRHGAAPLELVAGATPARRAGRTAWSSSGIAAPTSSSTAASSPSAAACSTSSPADERRPVRFEYLGRRRSSIRRVRASTQLSTSRPAQREVGPVASRSSDDDIRARARAAAAVRPTTTGSPTSSHGSGRLPLPEGTDAAAHLPLRPVPTPAELLPAGSWVVLTAGATHARAPASDPRRRGGRGGGARLAGTATSCGRRTMRSATAPSCICPPSRKGRTSRSGGWGSAAGNRAPWRGRRATWWRSGTAWSSRPTATVRSTAPARCSPIRAGGGRGAARAGFVFGPARSPCSPRRISSVRAASRVRLPDSPRAEATRSPTSSSRAISPCTESTGSAATRIVHRELAGSERDYLVLEYAKGDKLYVPSDAVGMVARYIGGDVPRVHRMGGTDWARATAKVKRAVRDMAGELVRSTPFDVGAGACLRSRPAVAARARGRVPVRGDARPDPGDRRGEARHGEGRSRWTGSSVATSGSARPRSRSALRSRR